MINQIEAIVREADAMKRAYFFSSPGNASARRSYEKKHTHPLVSWTDNGHTYTAEFTVSCSCKNVYATGTYTKDGKKTTLTAIRNSLARMKEAATP